ncbi:MAG: hypothetical protein WCL08_04025 [Verrucomicrobiota bacterium]
MGFLPSVTTVLGVIREEYLERWKIGEGIKEYKDNGGDAKAAVSAIFSRESPNAQFGTDVHAVAECHMTGMPMPELSDEVKAHAAPLLGWLNKNVKKPLYNEILLASKSLGVAGAIDMAFEHVDGRLILGDIKVVKFSTQYPPKPGLAYRAQLSAYAEMLREHTGEKFERVSIYVASPFGWDKKPQMKTFEYKDCYLDAFKSCRDLWMAQVTQEELTPIDQNKSNKPKFELPKR